MYNQELFSQIIEKIGADLPGVGKPGPVNVEGAKKPLFGAAGVGKGADREGSIALPAGPGRHFGIPDPVDPSNKNIPVNEAYYSPGKARTPYVENTGYMGDAFTLQHNPIRPYTLPPSPPPPTFMGSVSKDLNSAASNPLDIKNYGKNLNQFGVDELNSISQRLKQRFKQSSIEDDTLGHIVQTNTKLAADLPGVGKPGLALPEGAKQNLFPNSQGKTYPLKPNSRLRPYGMPSLPAYDDLDAAPAMYTDATNEYRKLRNQYGTGASTGKPLSNELGINGIAKGVGDGYPWERIRGPKLEAITGTPLPAGTAKTQLHPPGTGDKFNMKDYKLTTGKPVLPLQEGISLGGVKQNQPSIREIENKPGVIRQAPMINPGIIKGGSSSRKAVRQLIANIVRKY